MLNEFSEKEGERYKIPAPVLGIKKHGMGITNG